MGRVEVVIISMAILEGAGGVCNLSPLPRALHPPVAAGHLSCMQGGLFGWV
jgi:hypothetical protein